MLLSKLLRHFGLGNKKLRVYSSPQVCIYSTYHYPQRFINENKYIYEAKRVP